MTVMEMTVMTVGVMMEIMKHKHMMMFDNNEDGEAAVMTEMEKLTAGLAEPNVHYEMMPGMMNMTVLEAAARILMVMVVSITMMTAKMTVMMVAAPPDNDARD